MTLLTLCHSWYLMKHNCRIEHSSQPQANMFDHADSKALEMQSLPMCLQETERSVHVVLSCSPGVEDTGQGPHGPWDLGGNLRSLEPQDPSSRVPCPARMQGHRGQYLAADCPRLFISFFSSVDIVSLLDTWASERSSSASVLPLSHRLPLGLLSPMPAPGPQGVCDLIQISRPEYGFSLYLREALGSIDQRGTCAKERPGGHRTGL
jgi:hypothetical protein